MSIDARISSVSIVAPKDCPKCHGQDNSWDGCDVCHGATEENPHVLLHLEPREPGGVAGQSVLTITNPPTTNPELLNALIGIEIWGGSDYVMIHENKWADRVGYTRIRLREGCGG